MIGAQHYLSLKTSFELLSLGGTISNLGMLKFLSLNLSYFSDSKSELLPISTSKLEIVDTGSSILLLTSCGLVSYLLYKNYRNEDNCNNR